MSAPSEVIKDTIGVGGYQRSVEDYQRFVEDLREGQGSRAYKVGGGLISGFMQASMPLFFRQFELALSRHEEEMPVRKNGIFNKSIMALSREVIHQETIQAAVKNLKNSEPILLICYENKY